MAWPEPWAEPPDDVVIPRIHDRMMRRIGGLLLAWLPVLLWMALILTLSSRSDLPIRTNPQTGETIKTTFTLAKMAHIFEYSVLALLLLRALMTQAGGLRLSLAPTVLMTVLVAASFGALDEYRQSLVPNREPRLTDIALDTASALVACICVAGYFRLRRPALLPPLRAGDDVGDTGIPRSGGAPSFVDADIRAAQRGWGGEVSSSPGLGGEVSPGPGGEVSPKVSS